MTMKIWFTLLFLTISIFTFGQTSIYHPFPEDSAKWCSYACSLDFGGSFNGGTCQLNGRLLINGNWYSRILRFEEYCYPPSSDCFCGQLLSSDTSTFYIRQDTAQKKVWMYYAPTNSDTIFLDFDLHVGDTITSSREIWAPFGSSYIVSSIDSILIDGQYRTKYNYYPDGNPGCNYNYMIEGIGPDHGFFHLPNNCFEYIATLVYFELNSQIVIGDANWEQYYCHDFNVTIDELSQISFSLSPNPTHNQFTLYFYQQIVNSKLTIYDIIGKQIKQLNITSQTTTINCEELTSGIYFYQIISGDGKFKTGRLAIE
jgi:hypothetical protein